MHKRTLSLKKFLFSKLKSENKDMERLFGEYQEQSKQMVHGNFEAKVKESLELGK